MISLDAQRRVMQAASTLDTTTCREAAIVGAIIRTLVECGGYYAPNISRTTVATLDEWKFAAVDRTPPGMAEIAMLVDRFKAAYLALPK